MRLIGVQHHHAHLAACLAEHGEAGPAVGAIFDGSGYGEDGTVWGGELLLGGLEGFERVGLLFPVRLPGGDAAVRQPWRMACAWLSAAYGEQPALPRGLRGRVKPDRWRQVSELVRSGVASPLTTSAGRLFDAVAALARRARRGQLRGAGGHRARGRGRPGGDGRVPAPAWRRGAVRAPLVIDARPAVREVVRDVERGIPAPRVSARFHNALAVATATGCELAAGAIGRRHRRPVRRRLPEPPAAGPHRGPAAGRGAARPDPGAAAGERRRHRRTGSSPSPPRGSSASEGTAVFGLDDRIAELAQGGGLAAALFVALLLGLRHASDPDHLAAVSTLIASDPEDGTRRAGRLGPRVGRRPRAHARRLRAADRPAPGLPPETRRSAPPRRSWG